MEHKQAAKLIIENIQLLEQAKNLLENEVHKNIFDVIDKVIKQSVEDFDDDMIASCDFHEDQTWFLSTKWKQEPFSFGDTKTWKNLYAFYELTNEGCNERSNDWWLTNFFPNDLDRVIFNFALWKNGFNKTLAKEWKVFAIQMNNDHPQIEELGFKFNPEGNWYLPIQSLDQKLVVENYENDTLEDTLNPITEALEVVKHAHPYFDKIVQAAIEKFNCEDNAEGE